ncbi:XRE family transcriptional regulator [Amycolatopsis sp. NPDC059021]|uniref:XRE family transcriptional regulator n=1 Tax=Amycolatopsis sp. NPDC059021 TaxID=3346704 RepID=UPI0036714360
MTTPNTRLRAARERTPSPLHPGECLSRQELADQVNTHLWKTRALRAEIDAGYVGKLERGVIRWPGGHYREAFRAVLGAATDAQLGFRNTRRAVAPLPDGAGIAGHGDRLDAFPAAVPRPVPGTVGDSHIREVEGAAELFGRWDQVHGGWSMLEGALAQARWASHLVRADCPERLRGRLYRGLADLVGTCAFKLFDSGAHEEAYRHFRFALTCAEEAGDGHRRAKILARLVRLALWTGQPDRALTVAEYALVRADRLSPARQAMLHAAHAKALAANLRGQEALRAIGAADEAFHQAPDDDSDALWADLYTAAHHAGETGEALATLQASGLGRFTDDARFAVARAGFGERYPRARVLAELQFAALVMATGDPVEAALVGNDAVDSAELIRSERVGRFLRALDRNAGRYCEIHEVRDLREHIRETLGSLG